MAKLVSIITPSYNVEKYISETIESVINQTYTHWELLITDDASTDNTVSIIESYQHKDDRIKLFKLEYNSGAAAARNMSISKAKGEYIAFIDSDDLWLPIKLELQVNALLANHFSVCFSSYIHIDEYSKSTGLTIHAIDTLHYQKLLKNNYIGNLTGIYNAKVLGKIYNPDLEKRQDWCVWLQALKRSEKPALGIQEPLAKYRLRKNSISENKTNLLKFNFLVYHQFLKFSFIKSCFYMCRFLVEYFFVRPKYFTRTSD